MIDDAGARTQVTTIADTHLDLALAALDRVDLDQPAKDELVEIAHFVVDRDR